MKNGSLLNSSLKQSLTCSLIIKYSEHIEIRSFHTGRRGTNTIKKLNLSSKTESGNDNNTKIKLNISSEYIVKKKESRINAVSRSCLHFSNRICSVSSIYSHHIGLLRS